MTTAPEASFVDWLRLKSHVLDPVTGSPTLPAVLEEVRRRLDQDEALGLIYLDLAGGTRLEAQRGWEAYDDTVKDTAAALHDARQQGLFGRSDIVAPVSPRSDKFVLFVAGPLGQRELESQAAALRTFVLRALAHSRNQTSPLAAPLVGVARLHRDPLLRSERAVHRALDEAMSMSLRRRSLEDERLTRWLDSLIEIETVVTMFHPIVALGDGTTRAHEASTRGPVGAPIETAEALLALALRTGRGTAFEQMSRRRALLRFAASGDRRAAGPLFLPISPAGVKDPVLSEGGLKNEVTEVGLAPSEVVIEVAERVAALDRQAFRTALRALKNQGFPIAIDDMGAGYSSLGVVAEMEPDFLKVDVSLVRNLDTNPIKRSLLETVVHLARKVQAPVIGCGIETAGELAVLREMGVPLGEGPALAPPVAFAPPPEPR